MRRRLLASTLAVVAFAVALLGIPLGVAAARTAHEESQRRLEETAQRLAGDVEDRLEHHEGLDSARLARLLPPGLAATVVAPGGTRYRAGPDVGGGPLQATVAGQNGGRVIVYAPRGPLNARIEDGWLLVAALTTLSLAVGVGLTAVQSGRLTRPLLDLAGAAERLGSGDTRPPGLHSGIAEIDRVSAVLDRSAVRLGDLLRREREFTTDASHQLRTPLTALSIRLEEIALASDSDAVRKEAEAGLAQVERLAGVVETLLARARDSRVESAVPFDVAALLVAQAREWEPAYRRAGRRIDVQTPDRLPASGTPGGVSQAVAGLLDNALVHGRGTVTVSARMIGEHVVIEVGDEGSGVPDSLAPRIFDRRVSGGRGTGLGLALARALVEADGGRLELVRPRPPVFALFLPRE